MKKVSEKNNRIANTTARRRGHRFLFAGILMLILPIVILCFSSEQLIEKNAARASSVFSPHRLPITLQNYGTFSHGVRAHADINCNSCHQRGDNSITPRFAGHSACIDCHLTQFVTPQSPMCAICHSNVQSNAAPLRAFPASFNERFNMKFDHAAHNRGDGRPADGCVACHKPLRRGVALSIPVNLNAHNQCYSCHTPNRVVGGRDIGSCNMCHALGGYSRTSTNGTAFQANFAHSDHGTRQRLACADCHTVKAGAPQKKQVSSPLTAEHFSSSRAMSCMTCHNDKRAFGDRDFANCKRCHTQASFDMIR
ncbi:MAG: cytochrome c3 family protein [Pyrinomonadaceae bacterium]|nr:cytochrome c3 family protein [Pyrinomonadaceae bacterium]